MRAVVLALALAFVAVAVAAPAAEAWIGCRPYWDGETWDKTTLPDGTVVRTPHLETLCY
ncbi:MAG TPA: hypothetical protein VI997_04400 [Candidatus Thermoplasmatota archaeon]|nr:hypothetical protein [Candidatus Thermoplasmatota archaeon]